MPKTEEALNSNDHGRHQNGHSSQSNGDSSSNVRKRKRHESEESEVPIEEMENYIPTPPDGGWGWVIVVSSLCCNLIVDGIGYSYGVLMLELTETFDEPKSKISLIGSLLCGVYLFAGPFVSAMTNKFGCRPVVIVGTLIATAAFILATQSPSVNMLIITYGVMGGFGLGMVYLPAIVSVGYYFEKKRAFATGIAVCGSGVGTFVFPPLTEFLLKHYAWRGTLLIIAGIIFHGCVCGALMKPLEAKPVKDKNKKPRDKNILDRMKEMTHNKTRSVSETISFSTSLPEETIKEGLMEAKLIREKMLEDNDSDIGSLPSVAFVKRTDSMTPGPDSRRSSAGLSVPSRQKTSICSSHDESVVSPDSDSKTLPESPGSRSETPSDVQSPKIVLSPADCEEEKDVPKTGATGNGVEKSQEPLEHNGSSQKSENVQEDTAHESKKDEVNGDKLDAHDTSKSEKTSPNHISSNGGIPKSKSEFAPLLEVPAPRYANGAILPGRSGGSRTNLNHLHSLHSLHLSKRDLARPLYRKDIFYSGSVLNIPQYGSQPDMKSYIASITTIPGENDYIDKPSKSSKMINSCCRCLPRSARDILSEMIDLSLFKDISFMLICLGNIFAFLGFFVPFVFLVDQAVSLGIDKSQAALLISIIGVTNTIGRVLIGKLADLRIVDSLVITYVAIALCGVITMLCPFCSVYSLLALAAALFGLGVAAFISLSSIIICDRMGLDKLTNAFGLLSMGRGFAGMLGPPLAGYMYDTTKNYDLSFYIGGLLLLAGALCHVFLHLPCLRPKHPVATYNVDDDFNPEEPAVPVLGSTPQIIRIEDISAV